jgi:diaminopimelate epimerase
MPKKVELSERERQKISNILASEDFDCPMFITVGNPHCVILITGMGQEMPYDWQSIGKQIENMTHIFPHKTNVEFVIEIGDNEFDVKVWERGAGRTFACGTGACAVAFAMVKQGLASSKKPIEIYMEGSKTYGKGEPIIINFSENSVFLTNHASFEGKIEV